MKKVVTLFLSLVLCVCCVFAYACGESAEGLYKFKSVKIGATVYQVGDVAPWDYKVLTENSFTLELKVGGELIESNIRAGQTSTETGTWALDGKTLSITIGDQVKTATLQKGVITLTESNIVYVYEKA